jgi:hypothetical protein
MLAAVLTTALSAGALGATGGATAATGAAAVDGAAPDGAPVAATATATLRPNGTASAPAHAPEAVKAMVAAGNRIASKPYKWGGGHRRWRDRGYDCSGSVSYALHGAELVEWAYDSTGFMRYGEPGPGRWVTIYANRGHVFMVVAGLRFDTSGADPSRWQDVPRSLGGFRVRHPEGL